MQNSCGDGLGYIGFTMQYINNSVCHDKKRSTVFFSSVTCFKQPNVTSHNFIGQTVKSSVCRYLKVAS